MIEGKTIRIRYGRTPDDSIEQSVVADYRGNDAPNPKGRGIDAPE